MTVIIHKGDCREVLQTLEPESVHCVVTSPPYFGLRDYGVAGQIGLEPTPSEFVDEMVAVFREVRRVLRADGTLWLNLGDTYSAGGRGNETAKQKSNKGTGIGAVADAWRVPGFTPKQLIGVPWRVAFALQDDGWTLRQDIIWSKPNPMPESVRDRCTKAHEYIFLLSKSTKYYFDADAISEPAASADPTNAAYRAAGKSESRQKVRKGMLPDFGMDSFWSPSTTRNKRSVWAVQSEPFPEAHFATFPPSLIEPCILAGCPEGGTVLDPFGGAGTTGLVADRLKRNAVLIELNPEYAAMAERRIHADAPLFADVR